MKKTKLTKTWSAALSFALAALLAGCGVTNKTVSPTSEATTEAVAAGDKAEEGSSENAVDTSHAEYTAKLGHSQVTASPVHEGALYFAKLVAEKTDGRVSIEVYPSAQLGAERDLIESAGMGAVEMGLSVGSVCAQFQPGVDVICLPFLFETKEDVYSILDGDVGKQIFSVMENSNVTVLSHFENGFRQLGTNREIQSIDDLKGLKLRTPEGDIYVQTWGALGVNVTSTPWNETFTALQTGVVDGEEAPLAIFSSAGFGEVTKHFAYINYMYDPLVLYVSSSWLSSLPDDLRTAVEEAAAEAAVYQRKLVTEQEETAEKELSETWGMTFTHPDLEPFQTAVQAVYDSYKYQDNLALVREALK